MNFNHDAQQSALERAERYLSANGQNDLAGAVSRAIALYLDMQSRVAAARQISQRLEKLQGHLETIIQDNEKYVASDRLPWIEPNGVF